MLTVSANGNTAGSGIVWAVVPLDGDANQQRGVKGILLALDADDVTRTLWTSEQVSQRDRIGLFAKFNPPVVANGKVFVATYGDDEPRQTYAGNARPTQFPKNYYVAVYGLQTAPPPAHRWSTRIAMTSPSSGQQRRRWCWTRADVLRSTPPRSIAPMRWDKLLERRAFIAWSLPRPPTLPAARCCA